MGGGGEEKRKHEIWVKTEKDEMQVTVANVRSPEENISWAINKHQNELMNWSELMQESTLK